MTWLLLPPGHQQLWYWLRAIYVLLTSLGHNFKIQCIRNVSMSTHNVKYMSMGKSKKDITSLLTHWSYVFLALPHRYVSYNEFARHRLQYLTLRREYTLSTLYGRCGDDEFGGLYEFHLTAWYLGRLQRLRMLQTVNTATAVTIQRRHQGWLTTAG